MVKINGTYQEAAGSTLAEYLGTTDYDLRFIAVERNGEIVPRSRYGETLLKEGDVLEIVSFVGGG